MSNPASTVTAVKNEQAQEGLSPEAARRALIILLITVVINLIGTTSYSPMLSIHATNLGATGIWVGILFGGFYGVRLFLGRPIGAFSDKVGQRNVLLVSASIYPLLAILYALSPNVQALVGTRLLHGIASAMMLPMAMAYVGNLSKAGTGGRYASYFNFANFMGMAIGPLVGGLVVTYIAFKGPFYLLFILAALNLPLLYFWLPKLPSRAEKPEAGAAAGTPAEGKMLQQDVAASGKRRRPRFTLDRVTAGLLTYNAVVNANTILFVSFLPLLARDRGLSILEGGLLISGIYLISSLSQIPLGRLSDQISPLILVMAGGLVAGVSLLLLTQVDNFVYSMGIVSVMALGGSSITAGLSASAVEAGRRRSMGRFMGGFHSAASFGMIAGALGAGAILDAFSIQSVFLAAGLVTLGLLPVVVALLRGTPEVTVVRQG
jgi:MFS transporter, DHA1 family, multidrug resistance protein